MKITLLLWNVNLELRILLYFILLSKAHAQLTTTWKQRNKRDFPNEFTHTHTGYNRENDCSILYYDKIWQFDNVVYRIKVSLTYPSVM
jgi:hypothetical protein